MRPILRFLRHRPLVWLIPLAAWLFVVLFLALKMARTPDSEFIYSL